MNSKRSSGLAGYVMETQKFCVVCKTHDWLKNDRCRDHQAHVHGPEGNLTAQEAEACESEP